MIELQQITELTTLMMWRHEVLRYVFHEEPSEHLLDENRQYYSRHTLDNTHYAVVVKWNGGDAGCGSICLTEELPSPDNPTGKCAYLMNIYVREQYRKRGIAHEIVKRLVDEAKARDCNKIYLETTADGRSVYESLGFHILPDMMKLYEND